MIYPQEKKLPLLHRRDHIAFAEPHLNEENSAGHFGQNDGVISYVGRFFLIKLFYLDQSLLFNLELRLILQETLWYSMNT